MDMKLLVEVKFLGVNEMLYPFWITVIEYIDAQIIKYPEQIDLTVGLRFSKYLLMAQKPILPTLFLLHQS